MKHRICLIGLVVTACSGAPVEQHDPTSMPVTAEAPTGLNCVPHDAMWATSRWDASDTAYFCGDHTCYAVDLASGQIVPADVEAPPWPETAALDTTYEDPTLRVCAAPDACTDLDLPMIEGTPVLTEWDGPFVEWVAISPSGTHALAVTYGPPYQLSTEEAEWGWPDDLPSQVVTTFDMATGQQLAQFSVGNANEPCASAQFLDDSTVMATWTVCEGPGESSRLVRVDGTDLGVLGASPDEPVHTAETTPVSLGGSLWAFDVSPGRAIIVYDVSSASVVHHIDPDLGFSFEDVRMSALSTGELALVGNVYVGDRGDMGVGMAVVDPRAGTVVRSAITPFCGLP